MTFLKNISDEITDKISDKIILKLRLMYIITLIKYPYFLLHHAYWFSQDFVLDTFDFAYFEKFLNHLLFMHNYFSFILNTINLPFL